ncbi:MAG: hypothetical protein R3C45_21685 [Phycisphaerales bacterium]
MSAVPGLRGLVSWIDDRANPIVIKELRQAVQSRFIVTTLILLLILLLTTLMLYVMNTEDIGEVTGNHGAELFYIFQAMLLTTCLLFVPLYVGGRLAVERSGVTSDLLFVSTIRPSSIVWGKLLAGMIVMAMILSACAPFMVVTYLLRGIDPPTILFVIGLDILVVLAATMLAILVGAIPVSWIIKIILGLIVASQFLWTIGFMSAVLVWEMGQWGIGSRMGDWDFWAPVLSFIVCWLGGIGLLFFLTVALISPPPSNRVFPLRVYMTCAWLVSLGICLYLAHYYNDTEVLCIWAVFAAFGLMASMVCAVSERDKIGQRLRRSVPRNRLLRIPAFPLFTGAANGLVWSVLLIGVTLVGCRALVQFLDWFWGLGRASTSDLHMLNATGIAALYLFAYAMTAVFLRRWLFRHAAAVASTAAIAMFLVAMGCIVPVIVAFATDPRHWDTADWWMLLNPLGAIFDLNSRGRWTSLQLNSLIISLIWSGITFLLNLRWFFAQIAAFRPLETEDGPTTPQAAAIQGTTPGAGAANDG